MLSIQTNVNSMQAQENLRVTNLFQGRTISRLTSGYRINESGDDAAGLAVANMYRSDVSELVQGVRNANDGLSTLQIIDGGLNNISKMLDRMKTLATQAASDTFTGDRNTLNKEYQDLLVEIDRQAGMIGLASSGVKESRNNTNIGVYVGGSQQGTAKVSIELGGAGNRVDSTGLLLNATNIADGGATVMSTGVDITAGPSLAGSGNQSFTFVIGKGNQNPYSVVATVSGDADGLSSDEVLSQLNNTLNTHGVYASVSEDGELQFSGNVAFHATAGAASAGTAVATATNRITNGSQHTVASANPWAADAENEENLVFTVGGASVSVTINGAATVGAAVDQINAVSKFVGVYAFNDGGTVKFQSSSQFTISATNSDADGVFGATTFAGTSAPLNTSSSTAAAETAIGAVQQAVSALGLVQGKVGTAQNKLSYAIQLAQSQITSFSAAESRIRDADVAQEAANLTKAQVLQQASLAALAQANSAPQAVLSLLRG